MFEVVWNTKIFNELEWPADGSSPFVWSFGDATGYATHGDYVFGWKGDSLQRILDTSCWFNTNCTKESKSLTQSVADMNKCAMKRTVEEDIEGCEFIPSSPDGILLFWRRRIVLFCEVPVANVCCCFCFRAGLDALPGGYQADHGHHVSE